MESLLGFTLGSEGSLNRNSGSRSVSAQDRGDRNHAACGVGRGPDLRPIRNVPCGVCSWGYWLPPRVVHPQGHAAAQGREEHPGAAGGS